MTANSPRTPQEIAFVVELGKAVRRLKETRGISYPQIASECGVFSGRISGLVYSYVLVREEWDKVKAWVEKHSQ